MMGKPIFVFGSTLTGRHNRGEALRAFRDHGAVHGEHFGLFGNSFAIPTSTEDMAILPLREIKKYIDAFIKFAEDTPNVRFSVPRLACHNNEYTDEQIAPLFRHAPANCILPCGWRQLAEDSP
jgi:hypothetical protein